MRVHVFTSITPNYLPKARVLAQSVKKCLPESVFHLQLVDMVPPDFDLAKEPFDSVIEIGDLGLERPMEWLFKHSVVEACTGVKGFAVKRLLSNPDCSAVLYLDPDIVVLAPLENLLARLQLKSILLTPHLTEPETTFEAIHDNEFSVLQHGIYNLGFLGVTNSPEGRRFAEWWSSRLEHFCYDDIPSGLFTDQRWADLAPAYFADLDILRDPGYNVCTWNLTHRRVEGNLRDGFTAAGEPLYFYHFSGFDSGAQRAMLDRYGADMPALYELRDWYVAECDRLGQQASDGMTWTYDFFENGERITPLHRKRYRERIDLQKAFPNPFSTSEINHSYYHWFEANDESRIQVASATRPSVELQSIAQQISGSSPYRPADPIYQVYLSLCGCEHSDAVKVITNLKEKLFRRTALHLIGPERLLEELNTVEDIRGAVEMVSVPEPASHEDAFGIAATSSAGNWDFVFLTPDVVVPELFDLRLAWTAQWTQGAGTVSPINDGLLTTGIGIPHTAQSLEALDRACYQHSQFWNPEISEFLPDCAYFNRKAVRDALANLSPLTFRGFRERLNELRWPMVLADHIFTATMGPSRDTQTYAVSEPLASLRAKVRNHHTHPLPFTSIAACARRRQLHILHSWGGGLERWVGDYCSADHDHDNFILKSVGNWGSFGLELHLFRHFDDAVPLKVWPLTPAVKHTATMHLGYQAALAEIVDRYGIDAIFVSSLIGHSLDALETSVPTVMVCHDFYPFCPALNITFGETCKHCPEDRLTRCTESNPHHRFFLNIPPSEWVDLREQFVTRVTRRRLSLVAPSPSVRNHYVELQPELKDFFQIIPHGVRGFDALPLEVRDEPNNRRLRVVILGSLAPNKGLDLLKTIVIQLRSFADLFLVGCGEYGESFRTLPNLQVIPQYSRDELPGLLQAIQPDIGLLLSVVPETFSYTLQELMELGIPPVATRIGSFVDLIEPGVTGFLVDPEPVALLSCLRKLEQNRKPLRAVRDALRLRHRRRLRDMCADYERLLDLPTLSRRAYFATDWIDSGRESSIRGFQLMWRGAHEVFQEAESSRCRIAPTGTDHVVSLAIPSQSKPPTQLRLDLGEQPGFLILHRVQLKTSDNQCIWGWDSRDGAIQGPKSGIETLGGSQGCLLYLSSNDPHWILPVDNGLEALTRGGSLEIAFCYPSLQGITGNTGNGSGRKVESQRLLRELADARIRIADLERSLSWRITRPLRDVWGAWLKGPFSASSKQ